MKHSPLPAPPSGKLPSRRVSTILAAAMLAAGIGLGALIGPGPAASLANGTRAAAIARVVALLALGDETAASAAAHSSAGSSTPASGGTGASAAASAGTNAGAATTSGAQSETSPSTSAAPQKSSPSSAVSPTAGKSPTAGSGEPKPVRLPPIAHVWLIVLPYGQSFTNALGQSSAAPYLTGQLVGQGTLLSDYSSLAAGQLASSATLLSGQEAAAVSTVTPQCTAAPSAAGTTSDGAPGAGTSTSSTTTDGTTTPSTASAGAIPGTTTGTSSGTPCATAEPAGAQAADTFLHEVVPQIEASAGYREGGLIAITFATASEGTPATSAPATGTPATGIVYPAGTVSGTLTATGTPGALLLSPFLRHPGKRLASAFDALAPRKSLEELMKTGS
jgi:hypothetical protein